MLTLVAFALAAPPTTIRHQGRLLDSSGEPINDTIQVVLELHGHATNEDEKWTETHSSVVVADGYYSVALGSVTALPSGVFDDAVWLDVTADGNTLTPREEILAVPVALSTTTDPLASLCDRMSLVSTRNYNTLGSQLDADPSGASVCGAGRHVCNATEFSTYSVLGNCNVGPGWIVGGFSNTDFHRRALWNGQDAAQCTSGNAPVGYAHWIGAYAGRIHCELKGTNHQVLCCDNP